MLKLFKELQPFFEDNYRRIHVRIYAKLQKISPPTSSKILEKYYKEGLLNKEKENAYSYFFANREDELFVELQRAYYLKKFEKMKNHIKKELIHPVIILFGSFAKSEVIKQSDIDIAIFSPSKTILDLSTFEDKLKRKIQIFMFKDKKEAEKNPELFNNILNGFNMGDSW